VKTSRILCEIYADTKGNDAIEGSECNGDITPVDTCIPRPTDSEQIYGVCELDATAPFASEKISVAVPLVGLPINVAGRNVVKISVFLI
jgi:hypothetical protein